MFDDYSTGSMFSSTCNPFLLSQTLVNIARRSTFAEKISQEDPIWGYQISMAADLARAQAYYSYRGSCSSQLSEASLAHMYAISNQPSAEQAPLCAAPSAISPGSLIPESEDLRPPHPLTTNYSPFSSPSPALEVVALHTDGASNVVRSSPTDTNTNAMAGHSMMSSILTPPDTPEDVKYSTMRVPRTSSIQATNRLHDPSSSKRTHSKRPVSSSITPKHTRSSSGPSARTSSPTRKGKRKADEDDKDEEEDRHDDDYTPRPPPSKRPRANSSQTPPAIPPASTNNSYCHLCRMRFKRPTDFERHVESSKRHHILASKKNGTDVQMVTYECDRCLARFTRRDALKRHQDATCV